MGCSRLDKGSNILVAPHPGGKLGKLYQRLLGAARNVCAGTLTAAHVAVDGQRLRPVGLHSYGSKAHFLDQAARDGSAGCVKLVSAVGCLAQQDDAGIANFLQQRIVSGRVVA